MAKGRAILVTGGGGYIGAVLVPELLAAGHSVTVLDNFLYRQTPFNAVCIHPNFAIINGDARDESLVAGLVRAADLVLPLAALVGAPVCDRDPAGAVSTNVDAVSLLTGLMSPSQQMVFPNTNSGYGIGEKDAVCTEESPLRPISLYGRTKVEAEAIALAHGNSVCFRLATVFGMSPRMRTDLLVNDFVHRAVIEEPLVLFEGHFRRNFIHVRDVAQAFLHAIDHFDAMRGQAFNVGLSDANLSKLELCERIREHLPGFAFSEAPIGEDPDKRDYVVSNEKIEATGFRPRTSLDDGIAELRKGYAMPGNAGLGNATA